MSEDLPVLKPDAARGARTVARCHARLEVRRKKLEDQARTPVPKAVPKAEKLERLVLAGACVAYLVSMVGNVLWAVGLR